MPEIPIHLSGKAKDNELTYTEVAREALKTYAQTELEEIGKSFLNLSPDDPATRIKLTGRWGYWRSIENGRCDGWALSILLTQFPWLLGVITSLRAERYSKRTLLTGRPVNIGETIKREIRREMDEEGYRALKATHEVISTMSPDYELGKARREQLRIFAKHERAREEPLFLENRNAEIRRCAAEIREKSTREKSILEIATLLSVSPQSFLSANKKPLSIRQIRKILS